MVWLHVADGSFSHYPSNALNNINRFSNITSLFLGSKSLSNWTYGITEKNKTLQVLPKFSRVNFLMFFNALNCLKMQLKSFLIKFFNIYIKVNNKIQQWIYTYTHIQVILRIVHGQISQYYISNIIHAPPGPWDTVFQSKMRNDICLEDLFTDLHLSEWISVRKINWQFVCWSGWQTHHNSSLSPCSEKQMLKCNQTADLDAALASNLALLC